MFHKAKILSALFFAVVGVILSHLHKKATGPNVIFFSLCLSFGLWATIFFSFLYGLLLLLLCAFLEEEEKKEGRNGRRRQRTRRPTFSPSQEREGGRGREEDSRTPQEEDKEVESKMISDQTVFKQCDKVVLKH